MKSAQAEIEFWFEFGSNYSYLSVMRIEGAARRLDVRILWRPFLLGPIFRELGFNGSPFLAQREKLAYVWQDMERQCRKYGLGWTRPSDFPRNGVLPARVALLGMDQPWIGEFSRAVMDFNFARDRDINNAAAMVEILAALKLPAAALIADAQAEPNKLRLRHQTEEARRRGIFGAPAFFVGDALFWGNDRLDDALEMAASG